jgi:hypothetical protein
MASMYHCLLLEGDHVVSAQLIDCQNDAAALSEAGEILAASPFEVAEVWRDDHPVSIISRKSPAA